MRLRMNGLVCEPFPPLDTHSIGIVEWVASDKTHCKPAAEVKTNQWEASDDYFAWASTE